MASSSSSSSSSLHTHRHESINPNLLRLLVTLINNHVSSLLSNSKSRKLILAKLTSYLDNTRNEDSFDFSEQSVVSNLYWGIHNAEDGIEMKCGKSVHTSEKMLQAPASLSENGTTAGISNSYLICCAYFYLCLIRKVQGDEIQVAVHFLQAMVVAPEVVRAELAPEIYRKVVEKCIVPLRCGAGMRDGFDVVKWGAMSYKAWLMYHQVISYGRSPLLMKNESCETRYVCY